MGQFEYVLEGLVSYSKLWLMHLFVQCFPTLLLLWCTYRMCMVVGSTWGLFSFSGIVGFSYVIVSASMCAITWMSRNGSMYGV